MKIRVFIINFIITVLLQELEALRKELRTALQTSRSNEVRLQRALEEVDKLRGVLQAHDRDDKELRRRGDETVATVKRLEKQRAELLNGFRKQLQLIDNLKKQKVAYLAGRDIIIQMFLPGKSRLYLFSVFVTTKPEAT